MKYGAVDLQLSLRKSDFDFGISEVGEYMNEAGEYRERDGSRSNPLHIGGQIRRRSCKPDS